MQPKEILIVEDELITARYLKNIITKMGTQVQHMLDNGEAVLTLLETYRPDMIMMDINIKGMMDGLQLTSIISNKYQIPVIFITAYCDNETLSNAIKLSPYGYVVKPFTDVDISIAIKLAHQRYLENYPDTVASNIGKIQLSIHCWYDYENEILYSHEREVVLNVKQNQLLRLLIKYKNMSVSQEMIEQTLWPDSVPAESSVRTLVYTIRKQAPSMIIETQSKVGYILRTIN